MVIHKVMVDSTVVLALSVARSTKHIHAPGAPLFLSPICMYGAAEAGQSWNIHTTAHPVCIDLWHITNYSPQGSAQENLSGGCTLPNVLSTCIKYSISSLFKTLCELW